MLRKRELENLASVLESTVRMEKRMRVRICLDCLFKGVEHQLVIIPCTYYISDNDLSYRSRIALR